ncbi:hypothetical protein [Sphingobium boeckii]|uniref:VCBS repeat-containing protein n=1 Tax=Sphingobium boeckii TaxID=1082345 RepID=A0A7W9AIC7_9SPHN|nr:hypothetical protein [Sphingobium boeckii]MBB5686243.1 hypothetical protein [Sphingobium boeckii]
MRLILAAFAFLTTSTVTAQTPSPRPPMTVAEGLQLFNAAGYTLKGSKAFNSCGTVTTPKFTYLDLNADGKPEAISFDRDPACYGPDGQFHVMVRGKTGIWRQIGGGLGSFQALASKTRGWLDYTVAGIGCPVWKFDGTTYLIGKACPDPVAVPAPSAPALSAIDQVALFKAAGFIKRGKQWRSDCDDPGTLSYGPGQIETVKDLNGDGRPEAVVIESGTYCYGNTGSGFWLLSKQADASWKLMTQYTGLAEFLKTRGVGGWPDILIGGPGFCFPVVRWNGREYVPNRKEYQGKPCR